MMNIFTLNEINYFIKRFWLKILSHYIMKVMSLKYSITYNWQLNLVFYMSREFYFIVCFYAYPIGWSCWSFSKCYLFSITTGQVPQLQENPHSNYKGTWDFCKFNANLLNSGKLYLNT